MHSSGIWACGLIAIALAATGSPAPRAGAAEVRLPTGPAAGPAAQRDQADILRTALEAARARNAVLARARQATLDDPVARKLVDWALVDVVGQGLGPAELARVEPSLRGWPREAARLRALELSRPAALPVQPLPYAAPARGAAGPAPSWADRRRAMNASLRTGDPASAYLAVAEHRLAPGSVEYAEAEAAAGWLALTKLHDAAKADHHFARLEAAVRSPVSKARAAYWRGRAFEARGDSARAEQFYVQGAEHTTTFYGQLAAERAGRTRLVLSRDPQPTAQDNAAFGRDERARAIQLLHEAGERGLVRVFALHLGEQAQTKVELAILVDRLRGLGEQELSLLAYRRGAQNGHILHDRGYPLASPPQVTPGAEAPLVLAVVRQESQFDPRVRSGADARGMMQLVPATAREVAQKAGIPWSEDLLWDPEANMDLGSRYLGSLIDRFGGSYVMAAAGYNAGPSRPRQWVAFCGDPRDPRIDPVDFIECIPFSETRTYVMNVLSNLHVYRARLAGGEAALEPGLGLRRGTSVSVAANGVAAPGT